MGSESKSTAFFLDNSFIMKNDGFHEIPNWSKKMNVPIAFEKESFC